MTRLSCLWISNSSILLLPPGISTVQVQVNFGVIPSFTLWLAVNFHLSTRLILFTRRFMTWISKQVCWYLSTYSEDQGQSIPLSSIGMVGDLLLGAACMKDGCLNGALNLWRYDLDIARAEDSVGSLTSVSPTPQFSLHPTTGCCLKQQQLRSSLM